MIRAAQEARLAARFDEVFDLVTGAEEWAAPFNEEGLLIRVAALCVRDPVSALGELAKNVAVFQSPRGRFGYLIASGRAYGNTRVFDAAAAMFAEAAELIPDLDEAAVAELAYHQARLKWLTRENDPECGELSVALRSADPGLRFLALSVRAWMHAGLKQYREHIADLREALAISKASPAACDMCAVGVATYTLLRIAFETGDADALDDAEKSFEAIAWTSDTQLDRFQCMRTLAWNAFLHGHSARAQWLFKDAKSLAPSTAWEVIAHLDRAYVARMNMNEIWATEELLEADKLARKVTWADTRGEERFALTMLAVMFAPTDMSQAQRYVSTYIGIGTENVHPTLALSGDVRSVALQKYASGRVHQVLGNTELAERCFEDAFATFTACGYHYRAALCAWALSEFSADPKWAEAAREHAGRFPQSPLFERIEDNMTEAGTVGPLSTLTAPQRELAIALCHGLEVAELSRRFSRSSFTIEKKIVELYAALGVTNRNELRAELERLGLFT